MKVKATSAGKKVDLRDRCGNLHLRPSCDEEAELLSAIYRVLIFGGTITAKPVNDKRAVRIKWDRE